MVKNGDEKMQRIYFVFFYNKHKINLRFYFKDLCQISPETLKQMHAPTFFFAPKMIKGVTLVLHGVVQLVLRISLIDHQSVNTSIMMYRQQRYSN